MDGGTTADTGGRTIEEPARLDDWYNTPEKALWSLVLLGGCILNCTLLLAFLKRPGLRTISNRFVMNLTVSNLVTCCVLNPLLILDAPAIQRKICICAVAEGATALVITSSVLSVLLIALDQYLAVVDPLRYRTRIDTLKCGILITSVWIISLAFSLMAALNPNPKSLWLICHSSPNATTTPAPPATEVTKKNDTLTEASLWSASGGADHSKISMTYGLIHTIAFTLFAYLLPFIGVCWIYISIYSAAHNNSKRTRRTGSRPILSSPSFSDEYCPVRQDFSNEEFRRITKISSLSSIEESTENSPSQIPRRFSESANPPSPIQEEPSTVVFTVGSQKVDVSSRQSNDDTKEAIKTPISVLRAEFFDKANNENNLLVNGTLPDDSGRQCKSSHDLMCEAGIMKRDLDIFTLGHFSMHSESSEDDDEEEKDLMFRDAEDVEKCMSTLENEEGEAKVSCCNEVSGSSIIETNDPMSRAVETGANDGRTCDEGKLTKCESQLTNVEVNDDGIHGNIYSKFSGESDFFGNVTPIVTITPPHRTSLQRVSSTKSTSSYINTLKYRISNGSLFKYREETRAARVSAFVIVMSLICWTPYFLVLMLRNLPCDFHRHLPHESDIVAVSMFISTAYISPMLFGYRSKRVKRELKKLFCFRRELAYKNNRSLMAKKVLKRRHSGNLSHSDIDNRFNIFHCIHGKSKWPKEKVQFIQVPENALIVETCRSSFSSGASTQVSSTSTDDC